MDISDIVYPALIVVIVYLIIRSSRFRQERGRLTLPNGRVYEYTLGDNLRSYMLRGDFHGVEVMLPKNMPHMYLDSMRGGGRISRFVIDSSQALSLEGDFDKYYKVFVPKKYEVVALSILAPDVMVTLKDHATEFDVEIYGNRVRVISHKRISHNNRAQAALLEVAQQVMKEVDHRLNSWSDANSNEAMQQDLLMHEGGGVRVFGKYMSYWHVAWLLYMPLVVIGVFAAVATFVWETERSRSVALLLMGIFAALFVVYTIGARSRWRSKGTRYRRR